jgi:hypothetical protein
VSTPRQQPGQSSGDGTSNPVEVKVTDTTRIERSECCDGCGDADAHHWRAGGWYCYGCAACDLCGSPYCEDPSHAL